MRKLAIAPIQFYRYAISPLMASHCRFYPSCSCYAQEAIETHGFPWQLARRAPTRSLPPLEPGRL